MRARLCALAGALAACRISTEYNAMLVDDEMLDSRLLLDDLVHQLLSTN